MLRRASETMCIAAGEAATTANIGVTLAEPWNGKSGNLDHTKAPNPTGAQSARLAGVSCPTSESCIAVGQYTVAGERMTLAGRWNGKTGPSKTPQPTPQHRSSLGTSRRTKFHRGVQLAAPELSERIRRKPWVRPAHCTAAWLWLSGSACRPRWRQCSGRQAGASCNDGQTSACT